MLWIYAMLIVCAVIGAYGTKMMAHNNYGSLLIMFAGIATSGLWIYVSKNYKDLVIICAIWDALYTLTYTGVLYMIIKSDLSIYQIVGILTIVCGMLILNWK